MGSLEDAETYIAGHAWIRVLIPRPAKVRVLVKQRQLPRPRHQLPLHLVREAEPRGARADACHTQLGRLGVVLLEHAVGRVSGHVGRVMEGFLGRADGTAVCLWRRLLEEAVRIGDGLVEGSVGRARHDVVGDGGSHDGQKRQSDTDSRPAGDRHAKECDRRGPKNEERRRLSTCSSVSQGDILHTQRTSYFASLASSATTSLRATRLAQVQVHTRNRSTPITPQRTGYTFPPAAQRQLSQQRVAATRPNNTTHTSAIRYPMISRQLN